jgi:hypothetical protein
VLSRRTHESIARIVLEGSAETSWSHHQETFDALGRMLKLLWNLADASPELGKASRADPVGALEGQTTTLLAVYLEQVRLPAEYCLDSWLGRGRVGIIDLRKYGNRQGISSWSSTFVSPLVRV